MNQEIREELKRIQACLRQPFPPEFHNIRELPGKGYWAFISHHQYRERLDQVYPEWESEYTEIEQIASDIVCKCTIKILGISKQAIGSVPLIAAERNGKDISRGSAADRLAAEAFKNACEAWGIGRYLDQQDSVARYLNDNAVKLNNDTKIKLNKLAQYLRQIGELPPTNSNTVVPKLTSHKDSMFNKTNISEFAPDRNTLGQEINVLRREKNITKEQLENIMLEVTGVKKDSVDYTIQELLAIKNKLSALNSF